jgi:hypothetical protein
VQAHSFETINSAGNGSELCFPPLNASSYSLQDALLISPSGKSTINDEESYTQDTTRSMDRGGCLESIVRCTPETFPPSSVLASPGYNHLPPGVSHKTRTSSFSSLGSTQDLASSSSLLDIQLRAASSTKNRRKIQTPSTIPARSVYSRKSLGTIGTSDSRISEDAGETVKRRAIYTGSMYLDSLADTSDTAVGDLSYGDADKNMCADMSIDTSPSWSSVLSRNGDRRQSLQTPRRRPKHNGGLAQDVHGHRAPLALVDLNLGLKCNFPSVAKTSSMPTSTSFMSRSSSFLSTDPFAGTAGHRAPETMHHPIVLELLTALNVAIGEWKAG